MYKALYRKWRPMDFDTVCGQTHVTDVLKHQVATGKVSHAYLFCGSRGTGKTSCAKILAKAVNCLHPKNGNPCNECEACRSINDGIATDVIEMDAASNNGVDNVRDIKEEVVFTPAALKYRVYIIDEVHMLSPSAFNALLKTLEEPPSHVVFILATTELQKLPSTIISRCQHYDFRRLSMKDLTERLKEISLAESIPLEDTGALVIARMAQGGMRDAISLLELCAGSGEIINEENAISVLGAGDRSAVFALVEAIQVKKYEKIYESVASMVMHSKDLSVFWQELIDTYRDMMVVKTCKAVKEYLDLTEGEHTALKTLAAGFSMETLVYHTRLLENAMYAMQRVGFSKRSTAEITLTRMCEPALSSDSEALLARIARLEEEISRLKMGVALPEQTAKLETLTPEEAASKKIVENEDLSADTSGSSATVAEDGSYLPLAYWQRLIETLSERKPSIAGFIAKTKGYYAKGKGYLVRVPTDFVASILGRPETLLEIKSLISELEERNVLSEPFEILTVAMTAAYKLLDELEEKINND